MEMKSKDGNCKRKLKCRTDTKLARTHYKAPQLIIKLRLHWMIYNIISSWSN